MGPEALVTFLFRAPPEVRIVELLGSWDNFQRRYRMHNDRRRGSSFWAGCFKFENIIFDGDIPNFTKPRSGGLRQGGTYWYYYQLNHEVEAFDASQPITTNCPILPGQPINIIEVPSEEWERPERRRSDSFDVVGTLANMTAMTTLEPDSKFAKPKPPPVCKVHHRCVSDLALNGRLESRPPTADGPRNSEPPVLDVSSPVSRGSSSSKRRRVDEYAPPMTTDSTRSYTSNRALSMISSLAPRSRASQVPAQSSPDISRPSTRHGGLDIPAFDFGFDRPNSSASEHEDCNEITLVEEVQRKPVPSHNSWNRSGNSDKVRPVPSPNINNVHFNGARPATRFDFHKRAPSASIDNQTHYAPKRPASFASSPELTADEISPFTDDGTFDHTIHSPRLSAQTISSAGAETPFYTSAMHSRAHTASPDKDAELSKAYHPIRDTAVPDTNNDFASLSISPQYTVPSIDPYTPDIPRCTNTTIATTASINSAPCGRTHLSAYALPPSDVSSTSTITKLPSTHSNTSFHSYNFGNPGIIAGGSAASAGMETADVSICLPAVIGQVPEGVLMADAIFNDAGHLKHMHSRQVTGWHDPLHRVLCPPRLCLRKPRMLQRPEHTQDAHITDDNDSDDTLLVHMAFYPPDDGQID
ncbi:hypothetical protein K431DRAFT_342329 [Polychaeton citri CBS 116435]|uniref:Uncharacterized protein n=1 Tax=Polychaeton citri CBS 116435 TaxID=1314669 RepID=A0A9P4UVE0_9PEZI|nr:hypothetical protein K431DRAFT_342329 [Polychaeton citri CBS 116435]